MSRKAFTLVELLIVIGIIAVLAALMFPAVTTAVEKGRRSNCRGNIRQVGIALTLYAADHNGWYVLRNEPASYDSQANLTAEYPMRNHILKLNSNGYVTASALWVCPSDRKDGVGGTKTIVDPKTISSSYDTTRNCSYMYVAGYNTISLIGQINPAKTLRVPLTSLAPVLADESNGIENGAATPGNMPDIGSDDNHGANFRNVLYLDGHVSPIDSANAANSIFDAVAGVGAVNAGRDISYGLYSVD